MLPEATRRKCTNTLKMIRAFVVDRLRCGDPGLSCPREEKTWIAVFCGRGKKDGPILA